MALKDILEKIENDAKEDAKKIKAENDKKISELNAKTDKEIKAIEDETSSLSEKRYAEEKRLKISLATLELKNKLLAAKQNLIDEAFDAALGDIKALPAERYRELLINAILKIDVRGDEEIILGSDDKKKLGDDFIKDINATFSKNGRDGKFKLVKDTREGITGCVIKDGRKETICSFESIIKGKRKELEREIASMLFKGEA